MFCPQCGSTQSEELTFCKACGANLRAVRQAVAARGAGEKIDWNKTWVAEMFMSSEEAVRRQAELERLQGLTPEMKRYKEIKAGVITSCVGLGLAFFIFVLMEGIVSGGNVPPHTGEILRHLWVAGMLPVFVGIALIINGLFVSKKMVEAARREAQAWPRTLDGGAEHNALRSADTTEFIPSGFSVTEETTVNLKAPGPKR